MVTSRSVLAGLLALAMLTASACVQLDQAINGRDLECAEVSDDICARLADHIVGAWDSAATEGPIARIVAKPVDCDELGRTNAPGVRCWEVEAQAANGAGLSGYFYQREDGTIIDPNGEVIGT